jgi:hypothetical protein
MSDSRIFPRLPDNCDVEINKKKYNVKWLSDRTYSFTLNGKMAYKTELEVSELIRNGRIVKLNNGCVDKAWESINK